MTQSVNTAPQIAISVDRPATISDGAEERLRRGLKSVATKVLSEASRLAVDTTDRDDTIYEDNIREAFDLYLGQPTRWAKAKAYIRGGAAFLAGVAGTFGTVALGSVDATGAHFPWFVVALLVGVNVLGLLVFLAYKEA